MVVALIWLAGIAYVSVKANRARTAGEVIDAMGWSFVCTIGAMTAWVGLVHVVTGN